jgi:hypothetical protein
MWRSADSDVNARARASAEQENPEELTDAPGDERSGQHAHHGAAQ